MDFDEPLIEIRHLALRPDSPVETPAHPGEILEKSPKNHIAQKDIGLGIPSCHDVIWRAFNFDSQRT